VLSHPQPRGVEGILDDVPVPVQLREHSEARCQLWSEERDGLTRRDIAPRERTRLGTFCAVTSEHKIF